MKIEMYDVREQVSKVINAKYVDNVLVDVVTGRKVHFGGRRYKVVRIF